MANLRKKVREKGKNRYEVSLYGNELMEETHGFKIVRKKKQHPAFFYLGYVGQVGFVIALPIAGGAALGSYLDTQWATYPKMTLTGLSVGILISVFNFVAVIKEIISDSKN